jgi:O-acetylserine/cysteine efflux transporter
VTRRDTLLALLVSVLWGVNFIFIEYGLRSFPPVFLASIRFLVSAIPILWVARPSLPFRVVVQVGLTLGVAQFAFLFLAMDHGLSPGLASIVLQVQAGFTVALAAFFLHERPTRLNVSGLLLALGGLGVIAIARGGSATGVGLGLAMLSALSWAAGNTLTRHARPREPFAFIAWVSVIPPIPLLALSFLIDGPDAIRAVPDTVQPIGIVSVLYIGVVSTLVGYVLWTGLLQRNDAAKVVPFALLVPISGMTAAALVFGERYTGGQLAGAATIMAGVYLASRPPRRV